MTEPITSEELQQQIAEHLPPEARQWLADLLHDHLGRVITNVGLQAEIVFKAWERSPEMAYSEMQAMRDKLHEASSFLVDLVRLVTPPAEEE